MRDFDFEKIGFDFGIRPPLMLVGDMSFSESFTKANCLGVVYLFQESEQGERIPVQIAFIFENEGPAEEFLESLLSWVEKSEGDGDAVGLDFIENTDGGYTIAIYPEMEHFISRMIPKHLEGQVSPMAMLQTHFKRFDALGENYKNFKKNYGARNDIAIGYLIGNPNKIVKQSERYFKKKQFNFYSEPDIPQNSPAHSYKATLDISNFDPSKLDKPPKEPIEEIRQRRESQIKTLLPLTRKKIDNGWLNEVIQSLSDEYDSSEIHQAICNLVVFERLGRNPDLKGEFLEHGHLLNILEHLLSTFESFDSFYPDDSFFTKSRLEEQIIKDRMELHNYLSK